jgi:plasmid stabilization system protein ParE
MADIAPSYHSAISREGEYSLQGLEPNRCRNLILANRKRRADMPRGDKSKYTDKQERKADHIAESYEDRGVPEEEAERRAWATVNKEDGGGNRSGSGRGHPTSHSSAKKGGKIGGEAAASRPKSERSAAARKAAATRKKNAAHAAQ